MLRERDRETARPGERKSATLRLKHAGTQKKKLKNVEQNGNQQEIKK